MAAKTATAKATAVKRLIHVAGLATRLSKGYPPKPPVVKSAVYILSTQHYYSQCTVMSIH